MLCDVCLYFFYIEIRDVKWIKLYILFWDEIRIIVLDVVEVFYQCKELEFFYGEGLLYVECVGLYLNEIEIVFKSMLVNWDVIKRFVWCINFYFRVVFDCGELLFFYLEKMLYELFYKFE